MMDMNKLDILDMVMAENVYNTIVRNKRNTAYMPMDNGPIDPCNIDLELLGSEEVFLDLVIESSLLLHDGPTEGEFTHMDIVYTVTENGLVLCAAYRNGLDKVVALRFNEHTMLIDGNLDLDYYVKFYNVINLYKGIFYLG